jgi:hypothetical protein
MEHADNAASHSQAAEDGTLRDNSTTNGNAASAELDVANNGTKPEKFILILEEAAGGGALELDAIPHAGKAFEESGGMEISADGGDSIAIEINDVDKEDNNDLELTSATDVSLEKGNPYDEEIVNSTPFSNLAAADGIHPPSIWRMLAWQRKLQQD